VVIENLVGALRCEVVGAAVSARWILGSFWEGVSVDPGYNYVACEPAI